MKDIAKERKIIRKKFPSRKLRFADHPAIPEMIHKLVLCVAVITLISDSANGKFSSLIHTFKSFHFY